MALKTSFIKLSSKHTEVLMEYVFGVVGPWGIFSSIVGFSVSLFVLVLTARTKYPGLGGLKTNICFSWFWRLGSLGMRWCWLIWCPARAVSWFAEGCLPVFSHGRTPASSPVSSTNYIKTLSQTNNRPPQRLLQILSHGV